MSSYLIFTAAPSTGNHSLFDVHEETEASSGSVSSGPTATKWQVFELRSLWLQRKHEKSVQKPAVTHGLLCHALQAVCGPSTPPLDQVPLRSERHSPQQVVSHADPSAAPVGRGPCVHPAPSVHVQISSQPPIFNPERRGSHRTHSQSPFPPTFAHEE